MCCTHTPSYCVLDLLHRCRRAGQLDFPPSPTPRHYKKGIDCGGAADAAPLRTDCSVLTGAVVALPLITCCDAQCGPPREAVVTRVSQFLHRSEFRGQWSMFGMLFEGMGLTKVRSPALSRNFTSKGMLKFGSHTLQKQHKNYLVSEHFQHRFFEGMGYRVCQV